MAEESAGSWGTEISRKAIEVAAGLVFRERRLLITRRREDDHLGGLWEFPGGKREGNETFEECLRRELREELGIEVAVLGLLESLVHDYPDRRVSIRFYQCDWLRHEPKAIGCQEFTWVGPADLARYSFPPADVRLLEKLNGAAGLWSGRRSRD